MFLLETIPDISTKHHQVNEYAASLDLIRFVVEINTTLLLLFLDISFDFMLEITFLIKKQNNGQIE